MLGALLDTMFLLDFLFNWGMGWRYLFSSRFRSEIHEKWKRRPKGRVIADVAYCILAFIVLNGAIAFFLILGCIWLYRWPAAELGR